MIALAGKNGANISKQMKREELIKMGIPEYGFECIGKHRLEHSFYSNFLLLCL
jgi:hypothetical protein